MSPDQYKNYVFKVIIKFVRKIINGGGFNYIRG